MTPKQKQLVRRSWPLLRDQSDVATALFYERLFTINPSARRLFRDKDMRLQGSAFIQMLAMFVRSLDDDEPGIAGDRRLRPPPRRLWRAVLGLRARGARVAVGAPAVARTRFTTEVRGAWEEAYRTLAATMRPVSSGVV